MAAPPISPPPSRHNNVGRAYPSQLANGIPSKDAGAHAGWAAVSLLLGLLVGILGIFAVLMWSDAHRAKDAASRASASASAAAAMPGMDMASTGPSSLTSYAGAAPADADALAAAHTPYAASLRPAPAGPVANVHLVLSDINVEIAPGVHYAAWAWA